MPAGTTGPERTARRRVERALSAVADGTPMHSRLSDPHARLRLVLAAAALVTAAGAAPGVAHADSLVYTKAGNVWISHSDGSDPRPLTATARNWAWPSQADDGTVFVAGGAVRVNADGSDSDGSTEIYHYDQNGRPIGPYVETYGSRSTPACPTDAPTSVRVSPNGQRVSFDQLLCDNRDSFYEDLSNAHQTLISEDYGSSGWLDDGHILITHIGPTVGNAAYASYNVANPGASHGPSDDPYLQEYKAVASRSGNRVAVYEEDPNLDGSVHSADIRLYETVGQDVTDPVEKCTLTIPAGNASSFLSSSPTFTPDGTRLAWAEKDGIHAADTSDLGSCAAVTDRLLVAGAAYPFFGNADMSATAGVLQTTATSDQTTGDQHTAVCCSPPPATTFAIASAAKRAKLSRNGALTFAVTPAEGGSATVTASVKLGSRTLRFKPRKLTLAGRKQSTITVKLFKSDASRALKALKAHKSLTAKISISMTAANGKTGRLRLAIKLRR